MDSKWLLGSQEIEKLRSPGGDSLGLTQKCRKGQGFKGHSLGNPEYQYQTEKVSREWDYKPSAGM